MATYPKYRLCEWIDTSEEALSRADITVVYGIQARPGPFDPWMPCMREGRPVLFPTRLEAMKELKGLEKEKIQ